MQQKTGMFPPPVFSPASSYWFGRRYRWGYGDVVVQKTCLLISLFSLILIIFILFNPNFLLSFSLAS